MMTQELMLSIVLILVASAAGIGIGIAIARQSQTAMSIPVKQESGPAHPSVEEQGPGNYERARLVQRWLLTFNHFQRSLEDATTIEDMSRGFARAVCQEFAETGILVAL